MSIDRWMDKEAVVHIYNGVVLSHKQEHIWVSSNEVDKPRAYYTEWSKKEKYKYRILTHIYAILKDGTEEFILGTAMEKQTENRPKDMGVGNGEGEMYGERNMETYNTIYKIDSQWEFTVWLREFRQGFCDNLGGWDGEGNGREVQEGVDMGIPMANSCWCMTENHKIL